MRFRWCVIALAVLAAGCSESPPEDLILVSRVAHDVTPLHCDDQVSWTFGETTVERSTVIAAAIEISREENTRCEAELSDVTLRAPEGRTAVASGFNLISSNTLRIISGEFACGQSDAEPFSTAGALQTDDAQLVTLSFEDGARAELTRETSSFADPNCYEESGSWTGISGSLDGRSGAYRWAENELLIELVLSHS
jgi:hypothetical protein